MNRGFSLNLILFIAIFLVASCADVREKKESYSSVAEYAHMAPPAVEYIEVMSAQSHGPMLRFFAKPNLSGDVMLELNGFGLFRIGDAGAICKWQGGRYIANQTALENCPPDVPFATEWDINGAHTILKVARRVDNMAQTSFRGETLFVFLGDEEYAWKKTRTKNRLM